LNALTVKLMTSAARFVTLLSVASIMVSCVSRQPSKTTVSVPKLYGMPPSLKVKAGTEIPTQDGIVVVPADTILWSHGAYMEQLERALR